MSLPRSRVFRRGVFRVSVREVTTVKMTYTKSQFEMPDGKYLARFLGVTMREPKPGDRPRLGEDGSPLPPAMTWDFEIAEGPESGKRCDRLTGRVPTLKSGCGKMLAAVSDTILKDGQEIDLDQFVGQFYRVTVQENRVSDNPTPVRVYDHRPAPAAATTAAPDAAPSAADPAARWDYSDGVSAVGNKPSAEVQAFLDELAPEQKARIKVKPAGAPKERAKPAEEYGFQVAAVIPW